MYIKKSALDYFDIPIGVKVGKIGKIYFEIPWTSLLNSFTPVKVLIQDVYITIQPRKCIEWDSSREENSNFRVKRKKLEHHETFEKLRSSWNSNQENTSLTGKLGELFAGKLEMNIETVHIRYEDTSNRRFPVVFGMILDKLAVNTADDMDNFFSKNIRTDNFSLYANLSRKQELISLWER